jgi:hypothetical protein
MGSDEIRYKVGHRLLRIARGTWQAVSLLLLLWFTKLQYVLLITIESLSRNKFTGMLYYQ